MPATAACDVGAALSGEERRPRRAPASASPCRRRSARSADRQPAQRPRRAGSRSGSGAPCCARSSGPCSRSASAPRPASPRSRPASRPAAGSTPGRGRSGQARHDRGARGRTTPRAGRRRVRVRRGGRCAGRVRRGRAWAFRGPDPGQRRPRRAGGAWDSAADPARARGVAGRRARRPPCGTAGGAAAYLALRRARWHPIPDRRGLPLWASCRRDLQLAGGAQVR